MSLRRLALKVIAAALLLGVPTAVILCLLGRPIVHLLFQHGAFDRHSSSLTSMALIGYAVGLPGVIIGELIARTFYALKDARTPLFTNILNFGAHVLLILFLLSIFTGKDAIYAIPLAASGSATIEAALLILLIYLRLRKKIAQETSTS